MAPFSGSYRPEDTVFLLKPMSLETVNVATKERLIQSGQRHYSELLTPERAPNSRYLELFEALTVRYARRLATEIMALACHLIETRLRQITVMSLARAGTPIGALLCRALHLRGRSDVRHYSISIIRDRGIDENALAFVLRREEREPGGMVFVDGWTAKGVITEELRQAIGHWNARQPEQLAEMLYVVSDIGGVADVAATYDDYAIPSGILNATVSGLTSRSVLNAAIGPDDFHGCVYYQEFAAHDRSRWFLEQVALHFASAVPGLVCSNPDQRLERRQRMAQFLTRIHTRYRIADRNFVKPGVAEATRVLLRRLPHLLLLHDLDHPDVEHLRLLAGEKQVPIVIDSTMPIHATALIKDLS
jgi:hypothetical protein